MEESVVVAGASAGAKGAGILLSPFGRINLIITVSLLLILGIVGVIEGFEQHSFFPVLDRTVFQIVGADHKIGQSVDLLESVERPHFQGFFNKSFPSYLWFWLKFWSLTIMNLYFIFACGYLIYIIFKSFDNTNLVKNITLAVIVFLLLQFFVGLLMFSMSMAGKTLPDNRVDVLNEEILASIPMEGTFKLVKHIINKDLFYKIIEVAETPIGTAITNVPINSSINSSGGI